jgi:cobalt-zinc-cadmium efflux system membrane fusion protein
VTQRFRLLAPIDGEVIARSVGLGMEVAGELAGGNTTELYTLGALDSVWVFADVREIDAAKVAVGAKATITFLAYPKQPRTERIDWIAQALDPVTRTTRVRFALGNADRALRPEMYAAVSIEAAPREAVSVPRRAILRLGEQPVVFAVVGRAADGAVRFERLPVFVDDAVTGEWLPMLRGLLRHGDEVVVRGAARLASEL